MKKSLLIVFFFAYSNSYSQSIESLKHQRDSLERLIISAKDKVVKLTRAIEDKEFEKSLGTNTFPDVVASYRPSLKYESVLFVEPSVVSKRRGKVFKKDKLQIIGTESSYLKVHVLGTERIGYVSDFNFKRDDEFEKITSIVKRIQDNLDKEEAARKKFVADSLMAIDARVRKRKDSIREINRREEAAKRKAAYEATPVLERVVVEIDDVSGITWYKPKKVHYLDSRRVSVYSGKKDGRTWLRLKVTYHSSDWIFYERILLSYEGNTREVQFNRYEHKETDNDTNGVYEWVDISADAGLIAYLKKFCQSTKAKFRLIGKYTKDYDLSFSDRRSIKEVLDAYDEIR